MFSLFLSFFINLLDILEIILKQPLKRDLRKKPTSPNNKISGINFP